MRKTVFLIVTFALFCSITLVMCSNTPQSCTCDKLAPTVALAPVFSSFGSLSY